MHSSFVCDESYFLRNDLSYRNWTKGEVFHQDCYSDCSNKNENVTQNGFNFKISHFNIKDNLSLKILLKIRN